MIPKKTSTKAPASKVSPEKSGNSELIPNTPSAVDDTLSRQDNDPREKQFFIRTLIIIGGAFLVMLFFFAAFFFLAVRGAEKTVVPNIVEKELIDALSALQERELYPRIQVKYTGDPRDKGLVLSQDPQPGLYVKAGRRVILTVSQGAVADSVEEYVGMNLRDVAGRLTAQYSTYEPLLIIREPVAYVRNESPAGTVISQYPEAGTQLSEPTDLVLVVSRGLDDTRIKLRDFKDYSAENAVRILAAIPQPFLFVEDGGATAPGSRPIVVSQRPDVDSELGPEQKISLRYSKPELVPQGFRYGLFDYTMPEYPVPVVVELMVREPGKDDKIVFSMAHPGGRISYPYVAAIGSSYVLTVNGTEITRQDVLSDG